MIFLSFKVVSDSHSLSANFPPQDDAEAGDDVLQDGDGGVQVVAAAAEQDRGLHPGQVQGNLPLLPPGTQFKRTILARVLT